MTAVLLQNVASATEICESQGQVVEFGGQVVSVVVPAPPSVNRLWKNVPGVGRVRTKFYTDWQHEAGWRLRAQRPPHVPGRVMLLIAVERSWASADIDNRVKALIDLLVTHKVIDDDSNVVGFAAAWSPERDDNARLLIFPAHSCTVQFELTADGAHGGWFLITNAQPNGET